ncbi:MAG: shikimate kinase [Acidobacteriota bacterium]|nr:shikimate kinase [Acidobacteriota bacterium]
MDKLRPIIIAGFMGSGKTTVAQALARMLNRSLVDLDQEITASSGRTPGTIIEQDGEQSFREIETRILHDVLQSGAARVIALGGGAWTLQRNRDLISEYGGITIWLDVPFELCWERILASKAERPLAPDLPQTQMLYAERRPHYALAQLHVEVDMNKSTDEIVAEIVEACRT